MPRKKRASLQRKIPADVKHGDVLVSRLINKVMWDGKKSVAQKIVYGALERMSDAKKDDPVKLFRSALDSIKPSLEVRSRRIGGANYQVPVEVRPERRVALAIRWVVNEARKRRENTMEERLSTELLEALEGRGGAFKKKEDTHRMAEANKAFAHFRW